MPDATHRVHLDVLAGFYAANGGERGSDRPSLSSTLLFRASNSSQKLNLSWTPTSHKPRRKWPSKTFLTYLMFSEKGSEETGSK